MSNEKQSEVLKETMTSYDLEKYLEENNPEIEPDMVINLKNFLDKVKEND